jgi:fluoride exporter
VIAYLWVALGGALGSMARYGTSVMAARIWGSAFPWGTLIVNIVGSFIISFFGTLTLMHGPMPASPSLRTFVMVGFCGGFTTFSSFSLQTLELARGDEWLGAFANIALSVVLCLTAVTAGHLLAAAIAPRAEP